MIWAQAHDRVIGRAGELPWHLSEDLKHFRTTTAGDAVVMGRKQWESLPDKVRPLPGRRNVVLTRNPDYRAPGAELAADLEQALALVADENAWICGGGQVYREALGRADVLVVTEIDLEVAGDTYAPEITSDWVPAETTEWQVAAGGLRYRIVHYRRR